VRAVTRALGADIICVLRARRAGCTWARRVESQLSVLSVGWCMCGVRGVSCSAMELTESSANTVR
jgi:hypothetical protein